MRLVRFLVCDMLLTLLLACFLLPLSANAAGANGLPSDVCSLLSSQQLQKTLGVPFGPAKKATAPAAYSGQAEGANCHYTAQNAGDQDVTLIVYVNASRAEAKETFDKLSAFYSPQSRPTGIGDSAYFDKDHAIHVLKGTVRYFINIETNDSDAVREKHAKDLALAIAAQL